MPSTCFPSQTSRQIGAPSRYGQVAVGESRWPTMLTSFTRALTTSSLPSRSPCHSASKAPMSSFESSLKRSAPSSTFALALPRSCPRLRWQ